MKEYKSYTVVSNVILEDKELNCGEKILLINIIKYNEIFSKDKKTGKDTDDFSYINSWLIEESGISPRSHKRYIKHLKELGYIKDQKKIKHYEINWNKIGVEEVDKQAKIEDQPVVIEKNEVKEEEPVTQLINSWEWPNAPFNFKLSVFINMTNSCKKYRLLGEWMDNEYKYIDPNRSYYNYNSISNMWSRMKSVNECMVGA